MFVFVYDLSDEMRKERGYEPVSDCPSEEQFSKKEQFQEVYGNNCREDEHGQMTSVAPPVKPFLPPKCEAELLMIPVLSELQLIYLMTLCPSIAFLCVIHIVLHRVFHNSDRLHANVQSDKMLVPRRIDLV
jgi:hypothetical protein